MFANTKILQDLSTEEDALKRKLEEIITQKEAYAPKVKYKRRGIGSG